MSVQTGRSSLTPPPPSSTRYVQASYEAKRFWQDPNPVWMRELRQSARLTRTPIILATLTGFIALLMCSIGGLASVRSDPAIVGVALFHTYFSIAYFVVTWVGPAVAAATIASERSGGTWYALKLTGLGPKSIAQGKFLAALTYIGLYIVMLAPVGALPFLFGGVTATEVFTAFLFLGLIALLSVAFGLSISSKLHSSAVAIVVTLMVAFPLSITAYSLLGPTLSIAVHDLWPAVPEGPPIWLPTAYVRADFGLEYVAFLIVLPLAAAVIPSWFFYEVTVANMMGPSDDRSSGLRRWFLWSTPALVVAAIFPAFAVGNDRFAATLLGMLGMLFYFFVLSNIFAGEPVGPARRVQVHWEREGAGRFRRFMGPGIIQATSLLLMLGLGTIGLMTAVGAVLVLVESHTKMQEQLGALLIFAGYAAAFLVFIAGLTAWLRARATSTTGPRVLQLSIAAGVLLGPWIVAAIAGVIAQNEGALVVASPSPSYAFVMIDHVFRGHPDRDLSLIAGTVCAGAWALLGVGLLGAARSRARRVMVTHAESQARLEALLESEDADLPPESSPLEPAAP